jgi:hypothetical protein
LGLKGESKMAEFTSWADIYKQLLSDFADGSFRKMNSYTLSSGGAGGSRTVMYRSISDFMVMLAYAKDEAAKESGQNIGRTYAVNRGRG